MICEKIKLPNMPRPTAVTKILGPHKLISSCFFTSVKSKKNYQRKSSTLKHAVVNNNKF